MSELEQQAQELDATLIQYFELLQKVREVRTSAHQNMKDVGCVPHFPPPPHSTVGSVRLPVLFVCSKGFGLFSEIRMYAQRNMLSSDSYSSREINPTLGTITLTASSKAPGLLLTSMAVSCIFFVARKKLHSADVRRLQPPGGDSNETVHSDSISVIRRRVRNLLLDHDGIDSTTRRSADDGGAVEDGEGPQRERNAVADCQVLSADAKCSCAHV